MLTSSFARTESICSVTYWCFISFPANRFSQRSPPEHIGISTNYSPSIIKYQVHKYTFKSTKCAPIIHVTDLLPMFWIILEAKLDGDWPAIVLITGSPSIPKSCRDWAFCGSWGHFVRFFHNYIEALLICLFRHCSFTWENPCRLLRMSSWLYFVLWTRSPSLGCLVRPCSANTREMLSSSWLTTPGSFSAP